MLFVNFLEVMKNSVEFLIKIGFVIFVLFNFREIVVILVKIFDVSLKVVVKVSIVEYLVN